eukprot:COSAG02_NODE_6884_length_3309_cov_2.130841_1_plen_332_part_00
MAHAQAQAHEANSVKDMMEQQLLALMETGGSAEAALREEKKMRAEAEAKLAAMESQYESAVFALNERETGAVTERMLQKQKQLRSHVREVEQALRAREEDEVCSITPLHSPVLYGCICLEASRPDNWMPSACPGGCDALNPAAKRDSAPGASAVRQQPRLCPAYPSVHSRSLRVLVHHRLLLIWTQQSVDVPRLSLLAGRYSASSALVELRHRVSTSSTTTGAGATGAPASLMQGAERQSNGDSESRRRIMPAVNASADRASQPNHANTTRSADIGTDSLPSQQLLGVGRPDNAKLNVAKGFLDLSDVETVISRLEHQLGRPSTSPQLRHK